MVRATVRRAREGLAEGLALVLHVALLRPR